MGDLYYFKMSPPSRAVALTARILGVDVNKKEIFLFKGEHFTKDYGKINPERKVPVFVDEEGSTFYESRAIMKYMVKRYGKENHQLYPNDIKKQYLIDRYLNFDMGTFFLRFYNIVRPFIGHGKEIDPESKKSLIEAVVLLNNYLEGKKFITGDEYTLADVSMVTTASQLHTLTIDMSEYHNVNAWLERCKATIPYYQEENEDHLDFVQKYVDMKVAEMKKKE